MNNSRRFFIKMSVFLAALLFVGGCNSGEDLTTAEYDGLRVEYDKNKRIINFIRTSDENVTIIYKKEGDVRTFTTLEGETILVLASVVEHELKFTPNKVGFSKNSNGDMLLILPAL